MRSTLAILVGLALASSAAIANDMENDTAHGDSKTVTFSSLDADGNGKLSATEVAPHDNINFNEADQNGNGSLNRTEFQAALDAYDEDDDGLFDREDQGSQDRGQEGVGEEDNGMLDAEDK